MFFSIKILTALAILAPLLGGVIAGIAGKKIGARGAHSVTISGMVLSFFAALMLFSHIFYHALPVYTWVVYTWSHTAGLQVSLGLRIDHLTATMMLVVTFISLLVHIYSVGYMRGDTSNPRFFSYMSLFTFAMLCLVAANDFVVLFFGWEGVGLVSYGLIGFWFEREAAALGGFKAFIVNRVGDVGFILAIACALVYFGSADYAVVFGAAAAKAAIPITLAPGISCSLATLMSILLFIGAAGKSAQIPLHVWLPESMEGPTPISALIHAATMVTAGVYMLCRMSPILEYSSVTLNIILTLGAMTALLMGFVAVVQQDIKRVIAYSTLSQLGYMMMGVGASAYAAGLFHLFTHACFKALLFLAAGSVILGMHHEQDMRKMGGLWHFMPVTWITFAIGALALTAIPPFSGFYSKDSIIEAVHFSTLPSATFAYYCGVIGAFVTGLYTFRAFFLTFHGRPRWDSAHALAQESAPIVTVPLMILAIPSVFLGMLALSPLLYQVPGVFSDALLVLPAHSAMAILRSEFHGTEWMTWSALKTWPFWCSVAGILAAVYSVRIATAVPTQQFPGWLRIFYPLLRAKYGFDAFYAAFFVKSVVRLSQFGGQCVDERWINRCGIQGMTQIWRTCSRVLRRTQTGFLGHYALSMVCGLIILLFLGCVTDV